jgi:hypothetical protein
MLGIETQSTGAACARRHQQVPFVAVEVFEDCDGSVGFFAGSFAKLQATRLHGAVISPKVVGLEKKKYPTASLAADSADLLRS